MRDAVIRQDTTSTRWQSASGGWETGEPLEKEGDTALAVEREGCRRSLIAPRMASMGRKG